tara:strand:+ start:4983 stop:5204 length:222 start_codon:yes stop_codon:yes gene_type:complete
MKNSNRILVNGLVYRGHNGLPKVGGQIRTNCYGLGQGTVESFSKHGGELIVNVKFPSDVNPIGLYSVEVINLK